MKYDFWDAVILVCCFIAAVLVFTEERHERQSETPAYTTTGAGQGVGDE